MFGVRTIIADGGLDNPRVGDRFLMQVFIKKGYTKEILLRLNQAHVYWQALFVSDILTASGNKIDPRSHRPAKCTSEEITPAVADRAPDRLQFPDVEGRNFGAVPKSECWDKIRRVHRTNAQDMGMEMGQGLQLPAPIQRRRQDGGHFSGRTEAKQILLFRDTAIHARRQHPLGGTYTCRAGPRRMVIDISGSGGHPCPTSPHLHGFTSFLGKHMAVGQSITHRGAWMDK